MFYQYDRIDQHWAEKEKRHPGELQHVGNLFAIEKVGSDLESNEYSQHNPGLRRSHRKKKTEGIEDKTRQQNPSDIPVMPMKSATVGALDQEVIPTIPFRKGKLLAATQTRLDRVSLFRLLRNTCARVTGIRKWTAGSNAVRTGNSRPTSFAN